MRRNPKIVSLDPLLQAVAGLLPNAARAEDMVAALADVPVFLRELGVGHPEELYEREMGSGAFARAFELPDGRVLKLTTDRDDAEAAELVRRGGDRAGLVRVFDVRRMPSKVAERVVRMGVTSDEPTPLFAVLVEQVAPEEALAESAPRVAAELGVARQAVLVAAREHRSGRTSRDDVLRIALERVDAMGGGAPAMQFAHDLMQGWYWLDNHGYTLRDLHHGNVGLTEEGRAVILDLGRGSSGRTASRPEIPMAANPGTSKVDRVFDEVFDVIADRFPDFGEAELHEDEQAGKDNGAGSDRQYAYCMDGDPIVVAFAPKAEELPLNRLRGLMRHEFGHALEYRFGVKELEKRLKKKLPPEVERRADAIAEAVWGERIEYDERDVQCVGHGGGRRRPKYLPDERDVLRPNAGTGVTIREVDTGGKLRFQFDAYVDGRPERVGYIDASKLSRKIGGRVVYTVRHVYVEESSRRQGIATQLYEAAAREACRRRARLASTERNPHAFSNDFWRKQLNEGRARRIGDAYVLLDCEGIGGRLVANREHERWE